MSSQSMMYEINSSGDKPLFKLDAEQDKDQTVIYEGGDQGLEDFNRSDPGEQPESDKDDKDDKDDDGQSAKAFGKSHTQIKMNSYGLNNMKGNGNEYENNNSSYFGMSISAHNRNINDRDDQAFTTSKRNNSNIVEDQFNKKQMEFKGGKIHQIISDQVKNTNKIYANRYQGGFGLWYFLIDTVIHFENVLSIVLFVLIIYSQEYNQVAVSYPILALSVNFGLMIIKNLSLEMRQRVVTSQINNKMVDYLMITRKVKRFLPIQWSEVKPGQIVRVKSGQEFPADCLILDIQGAAGQKCFVTAGPFDDSTGIILKKSYAGTSNKTNQKQNEQHLAEAISGFLKYEYNYFGYIQGTFKLNDNPAASEFDHDNVVQRGALLTQTPVVVCLVINVGDQCMGSVFRDPKSAKETTNNLRLRSMVKTQRSFDKAYKHSIRIFLMSLAVLYLVFTGLAIYLASNDKFFYVTSFELTIMESVDINWVHYIKKAMGFFSILLSSIPLSFSNIIDLLVLTHTNFAEWDVNIIPANIEFLYPHATLAFGKVAHMFFSRIALQRDDQQAVKVFHVGGHFFLNKINQQKWDEINGQERDKSNASNQEHSNMLNDTFDQANSLEYLPNELKYTTKYHNETADLILSGPQNLNKQMLTEFFRGITLCHQATVIKDITKDDLQKYLCVMHDEIASLEFAQQLDFKLVQRGKKMMTVLLQGNQERYEELGVVTTKAVMGHFMTVSAMRLQGRQEGVLYMKGSIASLKHYFINKENDFQYLNLFEQKFIQSGVQAIVYAKRQLTIEETNQLIITINEGIQSTKENLKLDNMLYNLTSIQLEILGVLGVQKPIHLRNRVAVDDMVLNGVKPWIVSKEDEQTHLTSLNSMRVFQNCANLLIINGQRERTVMDQIQNSLKMILDRMSQKSNGKENEHRLKTDGITSETRTISTMQTKLTSKMKKMLIAGHDEHQDVIQSKESNRNVVIFTGRALVEILRDQTMIKSFMTLAYISDIMIGSEISPLQKQQLLKIAKAYIGEGEYAAAIVAATEDQFMAMEADLVANFQAQGITSDFITVSDVTFRDFSAISYLLFKHGNQIQMRLSKAAQAFFYRSLVTFLILSTYMIESGFSGAIPYTNFYYFVFMLFLAPGEILIYAIFYKDYAYDYLYRIFGHYKYNFSFSLVETEYVVVDSLCAMFDWCIIYIPMEFTGYGNPVSIIGGKNTSSDAYNCYQVILMQLTMFFYFKNTNVIVIYAMNILSILTFIGMCMIFDDDGLVGTTQLFTCPSFLLSLLFQTLLLSLRNSIVELISKLLIPKYSDLLNWYADVEERLSLEEYEDTNQTFSIQQFPPLFHKINQATIQNTLKLINTNMMKCPKTDVLENILDKINIELDIDMRGNKVAMSGAINRLTLKLNDLNKETEYQDNKNNREIIYVKRQMLVFIVTTLLFGIFGFTLTLTDDYTNIGIYYYTALSIFSIIVYNILPHVTTYISNILLFYTVIVIFCYTIYTSESESLQPTGLIFVLALVAGLNHSYIYITMLMIIISVMMNIFFSFLTETDIGNLKGNTYISTFNTFVRIFSGLVWSQYVYIQELEKKTQFVNGHRIVRQYLKLKQILNILVPPLVRDRQRNNQSKKALYDEENEVSIVFIELCEFDSIVKSYTGHELIQFLDQVYNVFDQLCDQYGLQKIETVGKTYMACGGLKSAEKKIESRLLNRHHSVRACDFGMEVQTYSQSFYLKSGKHLGVKIGIHSGAVIAGVIGDTKPQFALLGDTVFKSQKVCSCAKQPILNVSQETHRHLELYTNNYHFQRQLVDLKGKSLEPIFIVSNIKSNKTKSDKKKIVKKFDGQLNNDEEGQDDDDDNQKEMDNDDLKDTDYKGISKNHQVLNESDSGGSQQLQDLNENVGYETNRALIENQNYFQDDLEQESNKSDALDEQTMNVFGFKDDLDASLDDKMIILNATENQIYNLVERPKYLLSFDLKDSEQEFLYYISCQEKFKTTVYLAQLILLNKIVIFGDILQDGIFEDSPQFYIMFPIFLFELILIYKLNNPSYDYIFFWTYMLLLYGIIVLIVLLSYQAKYLGKWTITGFNELQIQLTLSLIFMMRNVLLRHFIITYTVYVITWFIAVILLSEKFQYQIIQFLLSQIMYAILLAVGIHHREMIQRKSLNYERILNVQIEQTNGLISKLVPFHMVTIIKNEKQQVMFDEFDDATLLFTNMIGYTNFAKNAKDPKEIVNLLSKLFSRFDQLCEENRVYKVHTVGECYVIMGYNGKIDKHVRKGAVVIDEINRVVQTGLEMQNIIKELKESKTDKNHKELDLMIGIHTGKIVAGIIGSKVVRYDIFGEGVLITKKMEQNGISGKVCISEDTKKKLQSHSDYSGLYNIEYYKTVYLPNLNKHVEEYTIESKEDESLQSESNSHSMQGIENSQKIESSDMESKGGSGGNLSVEDQKQAILPKKDDLRKPKKSYLKKVKADEEKDEKASEHESDEKEDENH